MSAAAQKLSWPQTKLVNLFKAAGCYEPMDGTIAQWDTEKPAIELDRTFVGPAGQSQTIRTTTYGTTTQAMPITFKHMDFGADGLIQNRQFSSSARDTRGLARIKREQFHMTKKYVGYLDEFMLSQMLTGTLTMTLDGASTVLNYGIPADNKPTAGTSWSSASADIPEDIRQWKLKVVQATGELPTIALCNSSVMTRMMKNTTVKDWMGQTAYGVQVAKTGVIKRMMDLEFVIIDNLYAVENQTERYTTPYIANNYLVLMPPPSPEWTAMQVGTVAVPNENLTGFHEGPNGPVFWTRMTDSPVGFKMHLRYARLPRLSVPGMIAYCNTGT